ncbi:glycosyltransferase family 62 protein [[Candida] arabinofermentans NRRL YB-2248]|uniref:Glycosyltransferase family 62 protein n=1 Tax=[Candida] arabinofermentans NRRL YB-2248 TaxID=983967 RepID=A0A1E4SXD7_9ASCO|nr:glycosyltransferase family 62 protein [[Candida] arabinofermentans NRRL YB-2248]
MSSTHTLQSPKQFRSDDSFERPLTKSAAQINPKSAKIFTPAKSILILVALLVCYIIVYITPNLELFTYTPSFPSSEAQDTYFYDLKDYTGTPNGWQNQDRVVFCVPLRDAASHLPMFFGHMKNMTYPHNLIDLAFLVSDSSDDTMGMLNNYLREIQDDPDPEMRFGNIEIFEKDFGQSIGQGFSDRHGFSAQGPRRKLMARARNWLTSVAIKPYHSWVYWRDVDVETIPPTVIEDLMHHDKDVIVPNVWRPLPDWLGSQQPYDLNSWQESDGGLQLATSLGEDAVIVEGYVEYATWRPHLAYLRDPYGDPETEMVLDGIGGVSILSKASVFKNGAHFPAFSFEKHAETEAFGKMCKRMGYSVVGLPHYVIWHIYEPSNDDLKHMEWMAQEEERLLKEKDTYKVYNKVYKHGFLDVSAEWEDEKPLILRNTDSSRSDRKIQVEWEDVDDFGTDFSGNSPASTTSLPEEKVDPAVADDFLDTNPV